MSPWASRSEVVSSQMLQTILKESSAKLALLLDAMEFNEKSKFYFRLAKVNCVCVQNIVYTVKCKLQIDKCTLCTTVQSIAACYEAVTLVLSLAHLGNQSNCGARHRVFSLRWMSDINPIDSENTPSELSGDTANGLYSVNPLSQYSLGRESQRTIIYKNTTSWLILCLTTN